MVRSPKEDIKHLEGKLRQNPNSMLFARLADLYLTENQVDQAIQLCEQGIRKHPYYVTGHYIMSKCYVHKKQFDHAEKELKRVLLFDPHYIAAHRDYGELMSQIDWNNSCQSSYEKIVEIDPLNTKAKIRLAEIKSMIDEQKDKDKDKDVELDMDLIEFEEAATVPEDSEDIVEALVEESKISENNTYDEFEEAFSENTAGQESSTDDEDDKFSFILDDIFKEEKPEEKQDIVFEKDVESIIAPNMKDDKEAELSLNDVGEIEESVDEDFSSTFLDDADDTTQEDKSESHTLTFDDKLSADEDPVDIFNEDTRFDFEESDSEFEGLDPETVMQETAEITDELGEFSLSPNDEIDENDPFGIGQEIDEPESDEDDILPPLPKEGIEFEDDEQEFEEETFSEDEEAQLTSDIESWLETGNDEAFSESEIELPEEESEPVLSEIEPADDDPLKMELADEEPEQMVSQKTDEESIENLVKESLESKKSEKSIPKSEVDEHAQEESKKPKTKEKIVTPTLGEIYTVQQQYAKAIGVYEILKKNDPDNPVYQQKIENLKKKLEEEQDD